MNTHGAREGQILIRDRNGSWHWTTPSEQKSDRKFLVLWICLTATLLGAAAAVWFENFWWIN